MKYESVIVVALVTAAVALGSIAPYTWHPSALFHIDNTIASSQRLPPGTVVLDVPAYDGAGYYQIARNLSDILQPNRWPHLAETPPSAYAYQRFLLPLTAGILAFGWDPLLPWTFLTINIGSLIGLAWFLRRHSADTRLTNLALCLCPAALIGLHFSLAEPVTLLLTSVFIVRFSKLQELDRINIFLLCLLVLAREVMILFVGIVAFWLLLQRHWRLLPKLAYPLATFFALHSLIYAITDQIPFLWSTEKRTWPLFAMWQLVSGQYGYTIYTATSIPLAVGLVMPALLWVGLRLYRGDRAFATVGSGAFLLLMTLMPDHIWGSITSIGRVITPVYPLLWQMHHAQPSKLGRWCLGMMLGLGLMAATGLVLSVHPFHTA